MRSLLVALLCLSSGALTACAGSATEDTASGEDALSTASATASTTDEFLASAREVGSVGELPTGYLGIPDNVRVTDDLTRHVAAINIKRRAIYTEAATRRRVLVEQVAQATGCVLLRDRVKVGQVYRAVDGTWTKRVDETPITLPQICATLL